MGRRGLIVLVMLAAVMASLPGAARAQASAPGDAKLDEERLLVGVSEDLDLAGTAEALGASVEAELDALDVHVLRVPAGRTEQVRAALSTVPGIDFVERDAVAHALDRTPDDPLWGQQWGLQRIGMPKLWDASEGREQVVIAILDTGVDPASPELAGRLLPGANFVVRTASGGPTADTSDDHWPGHGTAVAGIAAARGNNAAGIAGACWRCSVLPVKVLDESGAGLVSEVAEGMVWAAEQGADVINLSLGVRGFPPYTLGAAVDHAASHGAVVVASAGNDGLEAAYYPAAFAGVIGVAGSRSDDSRHPKSSFGSWVDVAAPWSTVALGRDGGLLGTFQGTSAAAPVVSGLAALLRSHRPDLSARRVVGALRQGVVPLDGYVRYGRVDVGGALRVLARDAILLSGDWDGDGVASPGWYSRGTVLLHNSHVPGPPDLTYRYGRAGDVPVVGDWDGDGQDSVSIVREGVWHIRFRASAGPADRQFRYGRLGAGDHPLSGDWDRDGLDTVGIVREGEWHLRNSLAGGPADRAFTYGRVRSGDLPLTGDWNGDGRDTPAIVRGGEWHLRMVNRSGPADAVFRYGIAADRPTAGDWNGNGVDGVGVVRGYTWLLRSRLGPGSAERVFDWIP